MADQFDHFGRVGFAGIGKVVVVGVEKLLEPLLGFATALLIGIGQSFQLLYVTGGKTGHDAFDRRFQLLAALLFLL